MPQAREDTMPHVAQNIFYPAFPARCSEAQAAGRALSVVSHAATWR